jgi:CheY-like chemotaxis protein
MQKHVLVVENERDMQDVLRAILELTDCRVSVAGDGLAALDMIEQEGAPDLIFLDLLMPKMDGVTFVQELQKREIYDGIPVIVLSGDHRVREHVSSMGMDVFIGKPFSVDEVLSVVDALSRESQAV